MASGNETQRSDRLDQPKNMAFIFITKLIHHETENPEWFGHSMRSPRCVTFLPAMILNYFTNQLLTRLKILCSSFLGGAELGDVTVTWEA
ncbi:MAG: hypothetical protein LBC02_02070 [Planctomycetaceae bacterium]|nr:hypothetical protein [Planctomycetaceae bacterium]